ncbi:protein kinase [Pseudanabaena biceps]|nr:protein kinase [Pseudanabaena biceps]
MSLITGQIVGGHYEVINRLGGGGFGETYLSRDLHLPDRPKRVIKRLSPRSQEANVLQIARRLFETEAQVLYRLGTHPQIPQLFAHFEELAEFYLVQEYVDGKDLSHELLRGKIWEQFVVANLLQSLLAVLSFVHQNKVIHRDIKPENIIRRRDGQLFLIDFGVVKEIVTSTTIATGFTLNPSDYTVGIGTPGYMPSEQAHGEPKFASDIYAIGMIGIQALTGIMPSHLGKDENLEILWRQHAPKVYPEFADILSQMVRFDFRQRYSSAEAAYEAVKEFCDRYPTSTVNHSLSTIQIITDSQNNFSTHLKDKTSASNGALPTGITPVNFTSHANAVRDSQLAPNANSPEKLSFWKYIQPWHFGLGAITISAIAITSAILFVGNPARSTRSERLLENRSIASISAFTFIRDLIPSQEASEPIYGVTISSDGKLVAAASSNRNIELWEFSTGKRLLPLKGHRGRVYDVYFSPDGKKLVSSSDQDEVIIWDVTTGKILQNLEGHRERVYTSIFSPDGKLVASSSSDRSIRIWNVETGKLIKLLQEPSWVYDVSFTPDSKTLVSGSQNGGIRIWDVQSGKIVKTIVEKGSPVRSIAYSHSGNLIASAMEDNTVRLWDAKTGEPKEVLGEHTSEVHSIAFSKNDAMLASGSADRTIRIWDLKTMRSLQVLSSHERGVSSVDFSEDSKFLISGSIDGKVKVWQINRNFLSPSTLAPSTRSAM